jgi:hypothetical protein
MLLKMFTSKTCPNCPKAHEFADSLTIPVSKYDISEREGLAEAAFHGFQSVPSFVLESMDEKILATWVNKIPTLTELKDKM